MQNKLKLDIDFLNICKQLRVYSKFLIFKLPNVSNKDALSIRKRLLRSAINKRNKEFHHVTKELSQSETFLSKQLSTIDFYIIKRSITSHNKKSLQKSRNTHQKKLSSLMRNCSLPTFISKETITNLTPHELSRKEADLLKAGLYFSIHPDKIRKSEIFTIFEKIHRSFINNRKSEETKNQIKTPLSYLANSYFYNYKPSLRILRQHRVLRNLRNNKDIFITKPDKGNGVLIVDRKLYDNAIQEIISDTSKFEKLNEDPTLKLEASLQRFLRKLKPKNIFNENVYDKLYPPGSVPARIYGTPKMHGFSPSETFPKLRPIVSSIGTLNYDLGRPTKKGLKKLCLFAISQTHFLFNGKFYNQIDGVAMGSPLAPVLANIFMGFYEFKWLDKYNLNKSKFYLRYVDDILAAFEKEQDSLNVLNFLNNKHPNIKFTIEKQNIPSFSLIYSFQVSIIKISPFKNITN